MRTKCTLPRGRYVVECIWSGYRASQERPCHRMVIDRYLAARLQKIHTVMFTDNTTMSVKVRPCKPREKVQEIRGYRDLLNDFAYADAEGFVTVASLRETKEEQAVSRAAEEAAK